MTRTWTTFGNGNFTDPNNWFYYGIPTFDDFVSFEVGSGFPYKVTFPGDQLVIGGGGTANYTTSHLRVRDNGVTFDGSTQTGRGPSTYTVASSTLAEANRGIIIGVGPGENASLTVSHSGITCCGVLSSFSGAAATIGDAAGATGTLNMNTGAFNVTGSGDDRELIVGNRGTGTLNVNNGADVSVSGFLGDTSLGNYATGVGTVNVSGVGSTWYSDWRMNIGREGRGTFTVQNGGTYTGSLTSIGALADANGLVTVTGVGSVWTNNSGSFNVGEYGQAFLNIEDGGVVNGSFGYLARYNGSVAAAVVTGTGSRWNNTSSLYVGGGNGFGGGAGGDATLNVSAGGVVAVGGQLRVWNTGTVDGDGTIEGNVLNEGVVAPGNSSGVFTITGNYTQSEAGYYSAQIFGLNQGTEYDLLDVGGVANLAGVLEVDVTDNGYTPMLGDTFEILRATGGVVGTFDLEDFRSIGENVRLTSIYGPNSVSLVVVPILAGDFNADGVVEGNDFLVWQRGQSPRGTVAEELNDWKVNYGNYGTDGLAAASTAVPEPTSLLLVLGSAGCCCCWRRRINA